MGSKPETKVVKKIMELLHQQFPGFYFKTHGGLYQRIGLPDILGVHRGRFLGIEVKCPGKEDELTPIQERTLNLIRFYGGVGIMSTSPEETQIKLKEEMKKWPIKKETNYSRRSIPQRKKSTKPRM